MSDQPEVSLVLLQGMVQRVLDGQGMLREDNRAMRRRLSRIEHRMSALEHAVAALQGHMTDDLEAETEIQDQIDTLRARLDRVENRSG